jgi:hypothetical protein
MSQQRITLRVMLRSPQVDRWYWFPLRACLQEEPLHRRGLVSAAGRRQRPLKELYRHDDAHAASSEAAEALATSQPPRGFDNSHTALIGRCSGTRRRKELSDRSTSAPPLHAESWWTLSRTTCSAEQRKQLGVTPQSPPQRSADRARDVSVPCDSEQPL